MKKSIKLLALGLAVVPCALVLTACGNSDDGNLVDISGKYTPVETTSYNTIVEEIDEGFDLTEISKGLKAVLTVKATADLGASGKITLNMTNEELLKGNPTDNQLNINDIEMYTKNSISMKMVSGENEIKQSLSTKQYMKNGKAYMDLTGAEDFLALYDQEMPTKYYIDYASTAEADGSQTIAIPDYKVSDLLAMIPEGNWGEYVQISKSTSDNGFKFKIIASAETLNTIVNAYENELFDVTFTDDAEFYLIYNNGQFNGAYLDVNAKIDVYAAEGGEAYMYFGEHLTVNVSVNAQVVGYNGQINFPDFDENYVDYSVML